MITAGIYMGSRTVKLAVREDDKVILSRKAMTSHNPLATAQELTAGAVFFAGGVALNAFMKELLSAETDRQIFVQVDPQIADAIGAAIYAETEGFHSYTVLSSKTVTNN